MNGRKYIIMKNIVLLALSVIVIFSFMSVSADDGMERIEARLKTIGLLSENTQYFNENGTINRGRMMEIAAHSQGLTKPMYQLDEFCFNDVPVSHIDYVWILIGKNNGWISGDEFGNFNPDSELSEIDAAAILINAASGYKPIVELYGGYPEGYKFTSSATGMIKDIGEISDKPVTKEKLLLMLNRYLDVPYFSYAVDEESGTVKIYENYGPKITNLNLEEKGIIDPMNSRLN